MLGRAQKRSAMEALELLASLGADLNLARADGATALDLAADKDHAETAGGPSSGGWGGAVGGGGWVCV